MNEQQIIGMKMKCLEIARDVASVTPKSDKGEPFDIIKAAESYYKFLTEKSQIVTLS